MRKIKSPVALRQKKTAKGLSLYLDIYYKGNRKYEFLGLYLVEKPQTQSEKQLNKKTLELAEKMRALKHLDVLENGFEKDESNMNLVQYAKLKSENRLISILEKFSPDACVADMSNTFADKIKDLLMEKDSRRKKPYAPYTISMILSALKRLSVKAENEGLIKKRITIKIKKNIPNKREHLSAEEVAMLLKHRDGRITDMFLFCCFTGLRYSDVIRLKWGNVKNNEIEIVQKKTKLCVKVPVTPQALMLMGERGEDNDTIFKTFSRTKNKHDLKSWLSANGITKHITFHCSRHTYAVLLLSQDVSLYVVSKLLGHTDVKTTQVYANIVEASRADAAAKLDNLFSNK
jgi:integrase